MLSFKQFISESFGSFNLARQVDIQTLARRSSSAETYGKIKNKKHLNDYVKNSRPLNDALSSGNPLSGEHAAAYNTMQSLTSKSLKHNHTLYSKITPEKAKEYISNKETTVPHFLSTSINARNALKRGGGGSGQYNSNEHHIMRIKNNGNLKGFHVGRQSKYPSELESILKDKTTIIHRKSHKGTIDGETVHIHDFDVKHQ